MKLGGTVHLCLVPAFLLAACGQAPPQNALVGEWRIRLQPISSGGQTSSSTMDGVLVFDPRLGCYCDEFNDLPQGTILGRGYIRSSGNDSSGGNSSVGFFQSGPFADRREELTAVVERDGRFEMNLSHGMVGPEFQGRISGDTARGTWAIVSHGDTVARSSFVMWRVPSSRYTDSALTRSARGIEAWRTAPPRIPGGEVDTARPIPSTSN
jgi:hypothetical protein